MKHMSMVRYSTLATLAFATFGLAGCATVKPSFVDASGEKITSVVVNANFKNIVTAKPSDQELSRALEKSVCKDLAEHGVTCNPEHQKPSHSIFIEATLNSRFKRGVQFWNPCLYQGKNNNCVAGMDGTPDTPAYMSLTAKVIESKREKAVFVVDKPRSFSSSEDNVWAATSAPSKAIVKGLKESGLIN